MSIRLCRAASLLVLMALIGCSPPLSKVEFNDKLVGMNKRLEQKAIAFRTVLFPNAGADFKPNLVKMDNLRSVASDMAQTVSDIRAEVGKMTLPRRSSQAPEFKSAYERYLDAEDNIVDLANQIVAELDSGAAPQVKSAKVTELLAKMVDIEDDAYKELDKAQREYATAHFFKPENKNP